MNIKLFLISLFLSVSVYAQITPSLSNFFRYGNGEQQISNIKNDFEYIENVTDFRLKLPYSFLIGVRFVYDNPPEIGKTFKDFSRRYIEYKNHGLKVRLGNSSELYGRGLVLNLFENRGLAYNSWIDGIKASYKIGNLSASIIAGEVEFTDSITIYRTEIHNVKGGNLEYKFGKSFKTGFSFIRADSKIPQFDQIRSKTISELPEIYFDYNRGNFNLFLNFANKWTRDTKQNKSYYGYGIYSSISYLSGNLGLTVDYKNYRFDLQNPVLQNDETRTSKFLPIQNPPIVMKEHSYTLLSRSLHQVDFNDEVGLQLEIDYVPEDYFSLNFNFSLASRHKSYLFNSSNFEFDKFEDENNLLPSSSKKFSPFLELFLDSEYYFDYDKVLRIGFAYREKTVFNNYTGEEGSHTVKSIVIPSQYQSTIGKNFSFTYQNEIEFIDDNFNVKQESFINYFSSILISYKQKLTYALRTEYTSNNNDISGRDFWFTNEIGYRFSGRNLITVSYGRERGGQVCSNGICQYILPFEGFRLTIQNSI